jgi:hypothetical protein
VEDLDELAAQDAGTRLLRANELLSSYQDWVNELSRMRREAIEELIAGDMSRKDIAAMLGVSVTRVGQLLAAGPQPERALFGTGPITVAIGAKPEAGKSEEDGSDMLSVEAAAAYDLISEAAHGYGLKTTREPVRPKNGHQLRLNRPNLIVVGSPRILRLMEQVLAADRHLGFGYEVTEDGKEKWHLTEHGRVIRSPRDGKQPGDYAYIGRLPRTDGRGTFLYLAGIHAEGTLGAATFLTSNVKEIYDEVKGKTWSMLVQCHWHPKTKAIESADRLTEIYYT